MVAVLERPVVVGAQVPRVRVVPEGVDHPRWDEVVSFVSRLRVDLDPWQWDVLRVSLMRTADGLRWAAFAVGVCAPRQNGKNAILEIRELVGAVVLEEALVIHTAHLADTSKEGFRRLDQLIDEHAWLRAQVKHIWRTNGHESIEFRNGCRIRFRTRTRGGGRGFSGSPVIFDEPMFLPEISMKAILPVVSAQPDPQIWYTGSAVDRLEHEDGVVFARLRDRALRGADPRLAFFEWSLDCASPDEVDAEVAADPVSWAATNPALGRRISAEYVEAEHRELDHRGFAVERLGVGDWPDLDPDAQSVIDARLWRELVDAGSQIVGPVCFAFDARPDRSAAVVCAAGRRADGRFHVEVVDRRDGVGWLVDRLAALRAAHETNAVVCDGVGPAASLVPDLEAAGVQVETVTTQDHGRACGFLFDSVQDGTLRHLGTAEMTAAVRGASTRPLGDAWAWSRKSSSVDISPLVGCTLALWAARQRFPNAWVGWK